VGVPETAIDHVFRRCLYSLTSLPFEELSALELLRWMSHVLPDPRIRCLEGGGTRAMCGPIADHLRARGADFRFGVEVQRLGLGPGDRVELELRQAPDRTAVRHILVPGFAPATPPNPRLFDAVVCTLPWERLLAVSAGDSRLASTAAWAGMQRLQNVHPLTVRLWFEQPIEGVEQAYILSSGTVFDVLRPTRTPREEHRICLVDALVDDIETHLPELDYDHERIVFEPEGNRVVEERVLADLERLYPGQIRGNPVTRRFLHTREGIIACRPGSWQRRPPQYIGVRRLVLGGDYTRQGWGVCMEGAVRSGQMAADSLLAGRQSDAEPWPFQEVVRSFRSVFERK
jgi:phytoene dehydrogenase-like protein